MKKLVSLVVSSIIAVSAMGVPARQGAMVMTAADGTEKTVFLHGDETFSYMTDEAGNWIDEETFAPISDVQKAQLLKIRDERLKIKEEQYAAKMAARRRAIQQTGIDRLLAPRGIVILVSFTDLEFKQSNEAMTDWAMGENYTYNGATGSIRQYFHDQSWGQYEMEIDVVGPVMVSQNATYYGKNTPKKDAKVSEMIVEACHLAAEKGADFSKYDYNNDGEVDWVVVLYAGRGEADGGGANTIWPHQYDLAYNDQEFELNGKTINHYCCLNELNGNKRCGIGTFCHEFSHILGLPDFYATNDATHRTLSSWDIMDAGPYNNNGNTPPNYSAYERWWMGWFKPRLINNTSCSVILPPMHEYQTACFMNAQGRDIDDILDPDPKTFYVFENRQQEGWDYYLKGEGLMITKIQYSSYKWETNTVNNQQSTMGVNMIEATENTSTYQDYPTDLYPDGATEFTQIIQYQVSNIMQANRVITFDVNGGGTKINLDVEEVPSTDLHVRKIVQDGKVIIVRDGQEFDILGNRL